MGQRPGNSEADPLAGSRKESHLSRQSEIGIIHFFHRFIGLQGGAANLALSRVDEPLIGIANTVAQADFWSPAHPKQETYVEELSGRSVRFLRVKNQVPLESHHLTNHFSQLANGDILAAADVDNLRRVVALQKKQTGICQIIDMEKFSSGSPGAPDHQLVLATLFGLMCFADQSGEDVRAVEL